MCVCLQCGWREALPTSAFGAVFAPNVNARQTNSLNDRLTPPPPNQRRPTNHLNHHQTNSYVPDANGFFAGQTGYGYISIAKFVATAR